MRRREFIALVGGVDWPIKGYGPTVGQAVEDCIKGPKRTPPNAHS